SYDMPADHIEDLDDDLGIEKAQLGFVVNLYDARKGFVVTSSLNSWQSFEDPPVLTVVPDLKEHREAVRLKQPLLHYAPDCEQSECMREIARKVAAA
ncbi:hypothetical protein, partial [Actinomadura kijaniata]|uniref:hypothetical protein n=1 Tax=Actinomadura kijaniata TaxID=46161 RepID=UPI003CD06E75